MSFFFFFKCFIILAVALFLPVVFALVVNVNGVVVGPDVGWVHVDITSVVVPLTPHLLVMQFPIESVVSYIVSPYSYIVPFILQRQAEN